MKGAKLASEVIDVNLEGWKSCWSGCAGSLWMRRVIRSCGR